MQGIFIFRFDVWKCYIHLFSEEQMGEAGAKSWEEPEFLMLS